MALQLRSLVKGIGELEVSLAQALQLQEIAVYGRRATSEKVLINPNKEIAD